LKNGTKPKPRFLLWGLKKAMNGLFQHTARDPLFWPGELRESVAREANPQRLNNLIIVRLWRCAGAASKAWLCGWRTTTGKHLPIGL
jgi:hypothetical protein